MRVFPNKKSLFFVCAFFIAYFLQQPDRREDWPFSYFGMYKGGRYLTKPLFKFKLSYQDINQKFSPYIYPIDYYFIDEKLREVLLGTKEDFNNDLLVLGKRIKEGKEEEVKTFLKVNISPVIRKHCRSCHRGEILLEVNYWDHMTYENFHSPDQSYTYTRVNFER